MRRNQIIFGTILLLVLGSFGGVYQFYFKDKLAQYAKDAAFRKELEGVAADLATFFSATKPQTVIQLWRNEVQPWVEALEQRAKYFDNGGWYKHETPPEAGRILRVWYGEELDRMMDTLYQKVNEKAPNIYPFPEDILKTLEVRSETDMAKEVDVTPKLINQELAKVAFATNLIDFLLDEKVTGINEMVVWPKRQDRNHKGQLTLQTVGLDVNLYMRHVVHLLENLRRQRRYFNVDAIHLSNPYVNDQAEPIMRLKLLITQGEFSGNLQNQDGAGSAKSLFGMTQARAANKPAALAPEPERGFFGKIIDFIKHDLLLMKRPRKTASSS